MARKSRTNIVSRRQSYINKRAKSNLYITAHITKGLICQGVQHRNNPNYILMDELQEYKKFERDESLKELGKRYIYSHGPGRLQDFVGGQGSW